MKQDAYSAGSTATKNDISISDLIHYSSSWTWRAVEALSHSKDFNADPKWIADRLNVSAEVAKDAFEGLLRIGLLKKTESGYDGIDVTHYVGEDQLERSDLYQIHSKLKSQINDRQTSRDCFANGVFLSNKKHIGDFYSKFNNLLNELQVNSAKDETCTEVYGLELSFSRLSR